MTGVLIKRGNMDTETQAGRMPCESEGNYLKAKGENYNRFLPYSSQKELTLPTTLISDF